MSQLLNEQERRADTCVSETSKRVYIEYTEVDTVPETSDEFLIGRSSSRVVQRVANLEEAKEFVRQLMEMSNMRVEDLIMWEVEKRK